MSLWRTIVHTFVSGRAQHLDQVLNFCDVDKVLTIVVDLVQSYYHEVNLLFIVIIHKRDCPIKNKFFLQTPVFKLEQVARKSLFYDVLFLFF